jgi:PAS domain S-box-containing protein
MNAPARTQRCRISIKILLFVVSFVLFCTTVIPSPPPLSAKPPPSSSIPLTPAERSWLQQHPVIRLAPDPEFKPIEFFDRKGHYQGVAADNIRLLEAKLGVKFSIVRAKNWDEVLAKFRNNEIDLLGAIVATPGRREFMRISEPLFHVPGAIIVRNTVDHGLTINDLRGKGMRVAVVSSYTAHDIIKSRYPDINLDVVPDTAAGLTKVSFGLVDAYVENLATATYYLQEMGISNIHDAGTTPFAYDWGIGIRKDWPELEEILNKGIAAITLEERKGVLNRWLPVSPGWRPGKMFIGATVAAAIVVLFTAVVIWNRTLTRRVAKQTAQLRNEVAIRRRAEEEVRSLNEGLEDRVNERTVELEREIAERQKAQESLQENESHLRIVADYASNWEYWRLPDDSFLYMSPSVLELTGYTAEDFNSDRELIYRIIHPEDRELFRNHTHERGPSGQILPVEMRIKCRNGNIRWIGHACQQVFTTDGLPWGWRGSNQDITERKQMEHELFEQTEELEEEVAEREAAQDELERLNRSLEERINLAVADLRHKDQTLIQQARLAAMGEMINNIAHQWRQPLNNIALIIQNLLFSYDAGTITRDEMEQEIGKAMDIIMYMSRTIDDFRNFFREDKQKSVFFVSKAVHLALEFVSAALSSHGIQIEVEDDESITTTGYQSEYAQVLLNILSNSSEACIERSVAAPRIHIRITSENGRSVVYIRDNCGGIADDTLPKIFDPYFTTRAQGKGTGIGLYMSKVIIEHNMKGHLTACNIEGGTEFRIEV